MGVPGDRGGPKLDPEVPCRTWPGHEIRCKNPCGETQGQAVSAGAGHKTQKLQRKADQAARRHGRLCLQFRKQVAQCGLVECGSQQPGGSLKDRRTHIRSDTASVAQVPLLGIDQSTIAAETNAAVILLRAAVEANIAFDLAIDNLRIRRISRALKGKDQLPGHAFGHWKEGRKFIQKLPLGTRCFWSPTHGKKK